MEDVIERTQDPPWNDDTARKNNYSVSIGIMFKYGALPARMGFVGEGPFTSISYFQESGDKGHCFLSGSSLITKIWPCKNTFFFSCKN